jgi:hypothetical protein
VSSRPHAERKMLEVCWKATFSQLYAGTADVRTGIPK